MQLRIADINKVQISKSALQHWSGRPNAQCNHINIIKVLSLSAINSHMRRELKRASDMRRILEVYVTSKTQADLV